MALPDGSGGHRAREIPASDFPEIERSFASILGIGQGSFGLRRVPFTNFKDTSDCVPISFKRSRLYFGGMSTANTRPNGGSTAAIAAQSNRLLEAAQHQMVGAHLKAIEPIEKAHAEQISLHLTARHHQCWH